MLSRWKQRAKTLKREILTIYLAIKDPRMPWYARLLAICVVGYALSPIDLIPDPIPLLGYLDDLILLPLGIALVIRLTPVELLEEMRSRVTLEEGSSGKRTRANWIAAGVIVTIWLLLATLALQLIIGIW